MLNRSCSFAAFGPTSNYAAFPSEAVTGSLRWLDSEESCSSPLAGNSEGLMKRAYEGQVVMAERGSCMFEEKTIQAEKAGARAVIVANSEVRGGFCALLNDYLVVESCNRVNVHIE